MKLQVENLWLRRFLSLLFLAVLWEILSRTGIIDPFYAPAPSEILRVVFSLFAEGTILNHLGGTFPALLSGIEMVFFFGISLGFPPALPPLLATCSSLS